MSVTPPVERGHALNHGRAALCRHSHSSALEILDAAVQLLIDGQDVDLIAALMYSQLVDGSTTANGAHAPTSQAPLSTAADPARVVLRAKARAREYGRVVSATICCRQRALRLDRLQPVPRWDPGDDGVLREPAGGRGLLQGCARSPSQTDSASLFAASDRGCVWARRANPSTRRRLPAPTPRPGCLVAWRRSTRHRGLRNPPRSWRRCNPLPRPARSRRSRRSSSRLSSQLDRLPRRAPALLALLNPLNPLSPRQLTGTSCGLTQATVSRTRGRPSTITTALMITWPSGRGLSRLSSPRPRPYPRSRRRCLSHPLASIGAPRRSTGCAR